MRMNLYVLTYEGNDEEHLWLPVCDGCGDRIDNFDEANIVMANVDGSRYGTDPVEVFPIGPSGTTSHQILGEGKVYHFNCEPKPGSYPWMRLSQVLREDQRGWTLGKHVHVRLPLHPA